MGAGTQATTGVTNVQDPNQVQQAYTPTGQAGGKAGGQPQGNEILTSTLPITNVQQPTQPVSQPQQPTSGFRMINPGAPAETPTTTPQTNPVPTLDPLSYGKDPSSSKPYTYVYDGPVADGYQDGGARDVYNGMDRNGLSNNGVGFSTTDIDGFNPTADMPDIRSGQSVVGVGENIPAVTNTKQIGSVAGSVRTPEVMFRAKGGLVNRSCNYKRG